MANLNAPSGLAPVQHMNGSPWNGQVRQYCILAADANPFSIGDLVTTIGNAGADAFGIPAVTLAAAGVAVRGVIVAIGIVPQGGPYINPTDLTKMTRATGTKTINYYCAVVDDPSVLFEVQEGGAGTVLTQASVSRNANIVYAAGAAGQNFSGSTLDNGSVATTNTLQLKIISATQRADNTPYAAYQKWLVMINNHEFRPGTTSP
jgi:hypothetical protein